MIETIILVEGKEAKEENLISVSLGNAKQLVVGRVLGFGIILHVAADSSDYLRNALIDLAKAEGVSGIVTLMHRISEG